VTAETAPQTSSEWLSLHQLVEVLDQPIGRVRRLLDDAHLIGTKRDGVFVVPAVFIVNGEPLASLRGTVIVLRDAGFTDDEAIDWLISHDDSIGRPPIEALTAGHKAEVRRVARTLA
jgi:hypothetical protein